MGFILDLKRNTIPLKRTTSSPKSCSTNSYQESDVEAMIQLLTRRRISIRRSGNHSFCSSALKCRWL